MNNRKRITIFIEHYDSSTDFDRVQDWLTKWKNTITINDYHSGGWEHCWDIETTPESIAEIPEEWLCCSEWSTPTIFGK